MLTLIAGFEKTVCDIISPGKTKEEGEVRSKLLTWITIIYVKIWTVIRMGGGQYIFIYSSLWPLFHIPIK